MCNIKEILSTKGVPTPEKVQVVFRTLSLLNARAEALHPNGMPWEVGGNQSNNWWFTYADAYCIIDTMYRKWYEGESIYIRAEQGPYRWEAIERLKEAWILYAHALIRGRAWARKALKELLDDIQYWRDNPETWESRWEEDHWEEE